MAIRKAVLWLSAILGGVFSLSSQAKNYNVIITGRLSDAGQLIGSVDSGPVSRLYIPHLVNKAGGGDPELTFRLGGPGGSVVTTFTLMCIQKSGVLTIDNVCKGGVAVNLPPASISWLYPEGTGEPQQNVTLSVTPQGQSSGYSFYGDNDFDGPNTDSTRSVYYKYTGTDTLIWPGEAGTVSGTINAYGGEGVTPGVYTGQVSVSGGPYADIDTTTYVINVLPALPKCSITPPSPVNFGTNTLSGNALIATANTTLSGSCTDIDQGDMGKGMYLTFYPGTYGWYDNNAQKLATNQNGVFITGDLSTPKCSGGDMYFDGQPHQAFNVGTISTIDTNNFSQTINFALCHDTGKKITAGMVDANAIVDVIIK